MECGLNSEASELDEIFHCVKYSYLVKTTELFFLVLSHGAVSQFLCVFVGQGTEIETKTWKRGRERESESERKGRVKRRQRDRERDGGGGGRRVPVRGIWWGQYLRDTLVFAEARLWHHHVFISLVSAVFTEPKVSNKGLNFGYGPINFI